MCISSFGALEDVGEKTQSRCAIKKSYHVRVLPNSTLSTSIQLYNNNTATEIRSSLALPQSPDFSSAHQSPSAAKTFAFTPRPKKSERQHTERARRRREGGLLRNWRSDLETARSPRYTRNSRKKASARDSARKKACSARAREREMDVRFDAVRESGDKPGCWRKCKQVAGREQERERERVRAAAARLMWLTWRAPQRGKIDDPSWRFSSRPPAAFLRNARSSFSTLGLFRARARGSRGTTCARDVIRGGISR